MSSAVVSTSAALGRPFVFDDETEKGSPSRESGRQDSCGDSRPRLPGRAKLEGRDCPAAKFLPSGVTPASRLEIRPAPEMVPSGVPALDALTGGLPRGCLTEICGPASSGRTTLLLAALAAATRRGEFCAVVDASDALDPQSAAAAGIALHRLLWVRCGEGSAIEKDRNQKTGRPISRASFAREVRVSSQSDSFDRAKSYLSERRLEQVLRATDLLLESGGFGLIVLDLGDLPPQAARRIPLATWFRFRRAIEHTSTILLAIEQQAIAGSCSSLLLQLGDFREPGTVPGGTWPVARPLIPALTCRANEFRRFAIEESTDYVASNMLQFDVPAHAQLFTGLDITAELIRSRLDRKPARSVTFATKTAWAG